MRTSVKSLMLILFIFILTLKKGIFTASRDVEGECERRCPKKLTHVQRRQLCNSNSSSPLLGDKEYYSSSDHSSIGPAICANLAVDILHLSFEDILVLCNQSTSAAPVHCLNMIDAKYRSNYGIDLCRSSHTSIRGECFKLLMSFNSGIFSGWQKSLNVEEVFDFCMEVDEKANDKGPILCMNAVKDTSLMPASLALDICKLSVHMGGLDSSDIGSSTTRCIFDIKAAKLLTGAQPLSPSDALQLCASISHSSTDYQSRYEDNESNGHYSPVVQCFIDSKYVNMALSASNKGLTSQKVLLSTPQRLQLCSNAYTHTAPIRCMNSTLSRILPQEKSAVKTDDLVALCSGAIGSGPGDCFLESRGLGTVPERMDLCIGAPNAGPAHCTRRSQQVFKKDIASRAALCVTADSEAPALCASSAPHYLSAAEKVDLCALTPPYRQAEPPACLSAVQPWSKQLKGAPKKGLGYFYDNLGLQSERTSRQLLINLCSFGSSQSPAAAGECFKSSPSNQQHDDVARMCTNISSVEVIQHVQLCHRILPKEWTTDEAIRLCEHTKSRQQVESAARCAVELSSGKIHPRFTRLEAANLCAAETVNGLIWTCISAVALSTARAFAGAYLLQPAVITAVCSNAVGSSGNLNLSDVNTASKFAESRGKCLNKLAAYSSSSFLFDLQVPEVICRLPDPSSVLSCLHTARVRMVSLEDIHSCIAQKSTVSSVKVMRIRSEDNDIHITAGKRFSIDFEVLDQWGVRFMDHHGESNQPEYYFSATLNSNNPQAAVLWGVRSNYSHMGVLHFDSLAISQPGRVEFKILVSYRGGDSSGSSSGSGSSRSQEEVDGTGRQREQRRAIEVFFVQVVEDESIVSLSSCMYVFRQSTCPSDSIEENWVADFPRIRSYAPSSTYMSNIFCSSLLQQWHVDSWVNAGGDMWVEFRLGIDSIWTGLGLPRLEMDPWQRLEISHVRNNEEVMKKKKELMKIIRRAYYRKSLQWHPDRWAGLPEYTVAVQGAFELITEAYETLSTQFKVQKSKVLPL